MTGKVEAHGEQILENQYGQDHYSPDWRCVCVGRAAHHPHVCRSCSFLLSQGLKRQNMKGKEVSERNEDGCVFTFSNMWISSLCHLLGKNLFAQFLEGALGPGFVPLYICKPQKVTGNRLEKKPAPHPPEGSLQFFPGFCCITDLISLPPGEVGDNLYFQLWRTAQHISLQEQLWLFWSLQHTQIERCSSEHVAGKYEALLSFCVFI